MSDAFLFDSIEKQFGLIDLRNNISLPFVNDNLSPKLELRKYQKQAFTRFYKYYETDNAEAYLKPQHNIHLAFQMATGSGKTVIMAGLILYLYKKGYRNFLFFVNRGQIVEKTKDNFINPLSNKYLFNSKIKINDKQVNIKAVDNFAYTTDDDINICFTTIQGLFSDFHNEKENSLTLEDFKGNKIALIADEAHHINASTKKNNHPELIETPSWENTVGKIFTAHSENILLEFSATIELDNEYIKNKYSDKLIYNYDIRSFIKDGFSKKITLFKSDTDQKARILQALITSIYREQVAIKYKLNIKPVVLFKSSKILESEHNQKFFHKLIDDLTNKDLEDINKNTNIDILKQAFIFFEDQNISINLLVEKIQHAFNDTKCLCTNNDKELEQNQKKLNSLEDTDNSIRAIFTVDKLNEGWDVLNLFDIVRLDEGRSTGGSDKGKVGKKTVSEAQLIGRGTRYYPFKIKDDDNPFIRKFDDDIKSELRVLEELYFHSENEHRYISEIQKALREQGLLEDEGKEPKEFQLILKDKYKDDDTFQNKLIFINKQIENDYAYVKDIETLRLKKCNFCYELASGKGNVVDPFDENDGNSNETIGGYKEYSIMNILGKNLIKNALLEFDTFAFGNLKKHFPEINSISDFLGAEYLEQFNVDIKGDTKNLSFITKLNIALSFLSELEKDIKGDITQYKGTKEFYSHNVVDIFKDKTLLLSDYEEIPVDDKDYFVFKTFQGTSEEKALVALIDKIVKDIQSKYQDVYLIRNERHFALYDFDTGRRFEPDFVLLSKDNKWNYQFFIEPKGMHLKDKDRWKEDFLKKIKGEHKIINHSVLHKNEQFIIVGLEFYNHEDENSFQESLKEHLLSNHSSIDGNSQK